MKLSVNGDPHEAEAGLTITGLLQKLTLGAGPVARGTIGRPRGPRKPASVAAPRSK